MQEATQISERRACRLVGIHRASKRYISSREEAEGSQLQARIKEIALERRRFGYRRIYRLLRREGFEVNHKRVYRLYREAGLMVRKRRRRNSLNIEREPLLLQTIPGRWTLSWTRSVQVDG